MPHFYFDLVVDGQPVSDPDGLQLAELREARFEAARTLAEMMIEAISEGIGRRSMDVTIKDASRKPLARVFISVREELH